MWRKVKIFLPNVHDTSSTALVQPALHRRFNKPKASKISGSPQNLAPSRRDRHQPTLIPFLWKFCELIKNLCFRRPQSYAAHALAPRSAL